MSDAWPPEGLEWLAACPVCGGTDMVLLYEGLTDRVFFSAPGLWTLTRCRACGSVSLDPRPTPETISMAYRSYYTHDGGPPMPTPGLRARLGGLLINAETGTERAVRDLATRAGAQLLDVGCGDGAFLRKMADAGWKGQGIDPDPLAVEAARAAGVRAVEGTLRAETFPAESFDAITLNHTLEHLHDPAATLRICRRLLRAGGTLWITTPNLDSQGHARFGRDWLHLDPPRHLVLFTPASLEQLITATGFDNVRFLSSRTAVLVYPLSAAVAAGVDPVAGGFVPPLKLLLDARRADVRTSERPELGEELIAVARPAPPSTRLG